MLVWGGFRIESGNETELGDGGRYALGHTLDDDGDGFSECNGDCNDGNASVFPGAPEVCDALDNDCNLMVDDDTEPPSEITGLLFESTSTLFWQPGPPSLGATHDVARGALGEYPVGSGPAEVCLGSEPGETTEDLELPSAGAGYWYLVRGRNACEVGTYGAQSDATERSTTVCP